MAGKEFINQELIEDWKNTIVYWIEGARGWGAKAMLIVYDDGEQQFKPLFVFPEQSIPVLARSLNEGMRPAAAIELDDVSLDSALFSILHFFESVIEN